MTRHFVLGNNRILVCLDKDCQVRDFYFPYVGQENHVNDKRHRIGIWTEGKFSWLDTASWKKNLNYKKETMVTDILAVNKELEIELRINDAVCHDRDIFIRKFSVKNNAARNREIRLFFHQKFEISEANIGDTVHYDPFLNSVIHYKGKRYFLMNGFTEGSKEGINSYATGLTGEYGMVSTYVDAEDGVLSNNPIEHGSVDSTISFNFSVPAKKSRTTYYWVCVGKKHGEVRRLNDLVLKKGPQQLMDITEKYWFKWVNKARFNFFGLDEKIIELFKRSLLVINSHIDKNGAIIASSDSAILQLRKDTYNYMWPRDGALIARSLDRAGYIDLTKKFFAFCRKVLTKDGYLFHKYRPDGSLGSSWHPWVNHGHVQLPIQEDQLALVLDALWKHYLQHGDKEEIKGLLDSFIRRATDFMLKFIDEETGLPKESYDLWEEKLGVFTFTAATVYAGLQAAANFEKDFGSKIRERKCREAAEKMRKKIIENFYDDKTSSFIKGIYFNDKIERDEVVDASSSYGIFEYGILAPDDEKVRKSMELFQSKLLCDTSVRGYNRYENDNYRKTGNNAPSNPWIITTLWLAEYHINLAKKKEDLEPAIRIFNWVTEHALETGLLPEQINPHTGSPLSVAPLTWSHAGFVIAVNKYLQKLDELGICKMYNPPKLEK
ncbi:MAG: glycoside hydrolase family 15 protein [Candidatus Woesearchaeota archaeon]